MQPSNQRDQSGLQDFADFIPKFFAAVFHDRDHIALRRSVSGLGSSTLPRSIGRDQAIEWLLQNRGTPNLFFADSTYSPLGLGGTMLLQDETTTGRNCLALRRAVFVRVAFGVAGTGRNPVFASFEHALAIRPET